MKRLHVLILVLAFVTGSLLADPVEDLCTQFKAGAEVRVYGGFQKPAFGQGKEWLARAKKAECFELLGDVFYPEAKPLNDKDAATWLALATNPKNYYAPAGSTTQPDPKFSADVAFWCVTPDHKNQVYCLVSLETSQMKIAFTVDAVVVSITIDLEKSCRDILQRNFEQEIKDEQQATAPQSPAKTPPKKQP